MSVAKWNCSRRFRGGGYSEHFAVFKDLCDQTAVQEAPYYLADDGCLGILPYRRLGI